MSIKTDDFFSGHEERCRALIGQRANVGSGFVQLVDYMGDDRSVVQAARVSYGLGTDTVERDRGLIRYLMRHRHTSPFEMVEFKFLVRVPMDIWRQWIRHRTASVNEYSTRYSKALDDMAKTATTGWRGQAKVNKQGSQGYLDHWPDGWSVSLEGGILTVGSVQVPWTGDLPTPGEYLTYREAKLQEEARAVYEERLALGVAREQARKDLPLSTYTEAYWKIDLHNLFHFLSLRVDSHAQLEIQLYGLAILGMIGAIVPWSVEAFTMYRLRGLTLSMLDREAIRRVVGGEDKAVVLMDLFESKGERDECHAKMAELGL